MIELNENQRAFFRSMKEDRELEGHGFRLLLRRDDFQDFFEVLKAGGFFAPERNPAPEESDGFVTAPYWPTLDYLRRCAERSRRDDNVELAEEVMAVVREVSGGVEGTFQDNSHTADVFAEIIGLVPRSVLRLEDTGLVSRWIGIRFGSQRIAHVLDEGPVSFLLSSDDAEDWVKALEIVRYCTAIDWPGPEVEEPEPTVDRHSLARLVERHAGTLGGRLRLPAAKLFEERVAEAFGRGTRQEWSDMFRPAIEDHEQNRKTRVVENCLVEGLRDATLAWCDVEAGTASEYVRTLLESDQQILRRIGLHVLNERWEQLFELYGKVVGPELFERGHLHELYALLKRRFEEFSDAKKEQTLDAIRALPERAGDDPARGRKMAQLGWADAFGDTTYGPARTFHRELRQQTEARELQHADFRVYTETRWGPGPSPYDVRELVGFAEAGVIAEKLNEFEPSGGWDAPSKDGLVAALEGAVAASPETFVQALPGMVNAKVEYRCGTLHALRDVWEKSQRSPRLMPWESIWPRIFSFLEELTMGPDFWKRVNEQKKEAQIASAIAGLLERGARDDAHAYPEELLSRGLQLIRHLLDEVEPTATAEDPDPMSTAINTTSAVPSINIRTIGELRLEPREFPCRKRGTSFDSQPRNARSVNRRSASSTGAARKCAARRFS